MIARTALAALLIAGAPLSVLHAQSMPVSEFLQRAEALEKKGMTAVFSGDIGLLKGQVQQSGKALRAEQNAAAKAGRKPSLCMPAKAGISPTELMAHLRAIPTAQRAMPIQQALGGLMRRKYPCPA